MHSNSSNESINIGVIGQGYVGLPLSVRAGEVGYKVTALDIGHERVDSLRAGSSYIEDISDERLTRLIKTRQLEPTTNYADLEKCEVVIITVPTPLRDRSPDLSYIEESAKSLAPFLTVGCLVILESTTYPGTTVEVLAPLLEAGSGFVAGADFHVAYSPERIDPGNKVWTLESTPKVVGADEHEALERAVRFYSDIVAEVVPASSTKAAELTKLLENTFRHVNIALVNELALFSETLGVDIWEVVKNASTKPFGFMPFYPGPGVGGHCLPIDPAYLGWRVKQATGRTFRFVELANDINEGMPAYVVSRVASGLNDLERSVKGASIVLIGLTYKKNSADARESPAAEVAKLLAQQGADLVAVDPYVEETAGGPWSVRNTASKELLSKSQAVVVLTDHDCFDFEEISRHARWILDCRNRCVGTNVSSL